MIPALPTLDPAKFFVDSTHREVPLVVEQATGNPVFAVVGVDLVPYSEWKARQPKPAPSPSRTATLRSDDGHFAGAIAIS